MTTNSPRLVTIVDDDESVRESLPDLLRRLGYAVDAFSGAQQFLSDGQIDETWCLILDIAMPGMTGPQLQAELIRLGKRIPIIFISAYDDERLHMLLKERGAVACLLKPFSEVALVEALGRVSHGDLP